MSRSVACVLGSCYCLCVSWRPELARCERSLMLSLPGVIQKAGWGLELAGGRGGVVSGREAVHASSSDTFPVHFSWWEGRAE